MEVSSELPERSNSDISLGMGFWGKSKIIQLSLMAARLLAFIVLWLWNYWFSRLLHNWGEGGQNGASQSATKHTVIKTIQPFFSNTVNISQSVARFWLISRVLKIFILTIFASILIVFIKEWIFRGLLRLFCPFLVFYWFCPVVLPSFAALHPKVLSTSPSKS